MHITIIGINLGEAVVLAQVTAEMIAAGEDVLLSELGGAVSSHWHADKLATQVYLAMEERNRKGIG